MLLSYVGFQSKSGVSFRKSNHRFQLSHSHSCRTHSISLVLIPDLDIKLPQQSYSVFGQSGLYFLGNRNVSFDGLRVDRRFNSFLLFPMHIDYELTQMFISEIIGLVTDNEKEVKPG